MSDFDVGTLIRDTLTRSKEADPGVIARRLVARIPDEEVRTVLADVLRDRVRIEIGRNRMAVAEAAESSPAVPAAPAAPSRWSRLSGPLRQRYCVAGEWKLLGDCTAEDCRTLAGEYAKRAAEQAAIAEHFARLADRLRAVGAATVADLGDGFSLGVAA